MMSLESMVDAIFELGEALTAERKKVDELQKENEELKARLANSVELPCKVGDTIYYIKTVYTECSRHKVEYYDASCWDCECECDREERMEIDSFVIIDQQWLLENEYIFGETYFTTREEAEQALKERENK